MRRMYSEQELTRIIGEVFDQKLESGALDSSISDAVDAYLVEHPVDITALEGQTVAPAVVNATTSISAPTITGSSSISGGAITGSSIIETMSGYTATILSEQFTADYVGCVKNGNKITFVAAGVITTSAEHPSGGYSILKFNIPGEIGAKLYPHWTAVLDVKDISCLAGEYDTPVASKARIMKWSGTDIRFIVLGGSMAVSTSYYIRVEATFLLSDSLVS